MIEVELEQPCNKNNPHAVGGTVARWPKVQQNNKKGRKNYLVAEDFRLPYSLAPSFESFDQKWQKRSPEKLSNYC